MDTAPASRGLLIDGVALAPGVPRARRVGKHMAAAVAAGNAPLQVFAQVAAVYRSIARSIAGRKINPRTIKRTRDSSDSSDTSCEERGGGAADERGQVERSVIPLVALGKHLVGAHANRGPPTSAASTAPELSTSHSTRRARYLPAQLIRFSSFRLIIRSVLVERYQLRLAAPLRSSPLLSSAPLLFCTINCTFHYCNVHCTVQVYTVVASVQSSVPPLLLLLPLLRLQSNPQISSIS